MTSFNIPSIGTNIILKKDWKFTLWYSGNSIFLSRKKILKNGGISCQYVLPRNTELRIKSIHIPSVITMTPKITFFIIDCPDNDLKPTIPIQPNMLAYPSRAVVKFHSDITDCNKIVY